MSRDNTREENPADLGNQERRQLYRWKVSIPCTMERGDTIITGQIANLSEGGASITQVNAVPSEGARVLLTFHTRVGGVRLKNKLVARIVYVILEAMEELISGSIGSFGVEFEEPPEQMKGKLLLLDNRKNEDQIRSTKLDLTQFCDHRNQFKPKSNFWTPPATTLPSTTCCGG
ncbi:MAG: PilZ domain-containing protein [Deltaproteobacteria bacterium]|nr:PilZ domain-containing protein [Deltaproteobacteria bacterium]